MIDLHQQIHTPASTKGVVADAARMPIAGKHRAPQFVMKWRTLTLDPVAQRSLEVRMGPQLGQLPEPAVHIPHEVTVAPRTDSSTLDKTSDQSDSGIKWRHHASESDG